MVPKESGFNQSETEWDVLYARLPWQGMVKFYKIKQRQHFFHYGDTICHLRPGYVTTKLHGTCTADATIMRSFQTELFSSFLPATLIWPRRSLGRSCQGSKMATMLNSLSFVFKISFLPKYHVVHYDHIVKWCSGI